MKEADAKHLEQMTQACEVSPGLSREGADLTCYEIEIVEGKKVRHLKADDMSVTPEMAKLVEHLMEHAKPQPLQ